jgi:signal transduction histidine kinase/CheY-like chemotaxis protein
MQKFGKMNILERIIGNSEQFTIEHRLLNGSCAIGIVLALAILINNLALGLDPFLNFIIGFSVIFFCLLYYLTRIKEYYLIPMWGLIIFCVVFIPPAWFLNSGLLGSTAYICINILAAFLVITRGKSRIIITTLLIAEIFMVIIIEFFRPDLVVPYASRLQQIVDITLTFTFSLVMMTVMITFVMKNYEEEKKKAEESNKLKSYFLANISHEIRTPMNSILGFSGLLRDRSLPEEEKTHYIDIIHKSGRHLLELIDDIIDLARIEAGQVVLNPRPFPLDILMRDLYDIFSLQTKDLKKNIRLILKHPEASRAESILADEIRLRQILMNLIGNAVKFTESGCVEFGYRITADDKLMFFISDTGIGISHEHVSRIFQQFKQADDSHTRKYGGAGLGLSISKKLINLMGGDIWLETEPGTGTTFYFEIPYRIAEHVEIRKEQVEPGAVEVKSRDIWKNRTVLVVEDDNNSYRFLERVMTRYGINVIRSVNGLEAVEICRSNLNIDCVLMDIQLPFISGNEAAKMIREIRNDLPIIAQSGNAYEADRSASIQAGCNDFITKPILHEKLLAILDRYL